MRGILFSKITLNMISSHAKVTPMPTKTNKYLHQKVLFTSKWSLEYSLNDKSILPKNQISRRDNSHINNNNIILTYACNFKIIIAKDFLKNLENCERVVFFRKVIEQKIVKLRYILQANINSILVCIIEQYYHHLLSPELYCSYCNHHF